MVVLGVAARSRAPVQLGLCLLTAAATIISLPRRLWGPQLKRLGLFSLLLFVMTALGAGRRTFILPEPSLPIQSTR